MKVQVEALIDSGATTTFINQSVVDKHNLVTYKLASPFTVVNADGTSNQHGQIRDSVRAYLEIGSHKSSNQMLVTDLGNKDMIIGMTYLRRHNPEIDWAAGEWRFTRCPETCGHRARKSQRISQDEVDALEMQRWKPWDDPLDHLGEDCPKNPYINWLSTDEPVELEVVEIVASMTAKDMDYFDDDDTSDSDNWKSLVPKEFWEYGDVFSKKKSERMPTRKPYDHAIEFEENASLPKPAKLYPMSPMERNSLDQWIDEELQKGYIRPSKSPIAAPVFFVKKKDGTLRLVQDYRKLNEITVKNRYPIPRITDLIDSLSQASIFTKIDLRWGYNNVRIKKGDEWKTTFVTHRGLFEAKVMYFGFSNAPAIFQAMMNDLLSDLIREGHVMVYLDDILIFTKDKKENRRITKEVLKRLQENDLYAKPEKCLFEKDRIEYLGMIISHGHIEMDPSKLSGVMDWPRPKKVKEVQAFLGFANFYRRFIQDFAEHAKPLTELTRKNQPWKWEESQEQAFQALKRAFTSAPILRIPDDENPFRLETDASDVATGAVLSQLDPSDNLWHPVAFYSKSLNVHERNYEIYDKELLGIVRALEEYRQHLEGHPIPIEIHSDHKNLTFFKVPQKLTRRQARWSLYLTRFNFVLTHKPGKKMYVSDPLSRRPDHEEGVNLDNSDQILLKPEFFAISAIEPTHDAPINDDTILREVKEALLNDEVTKNYQELLKTGPREFGKALEEWNYENGLLLHRGKVYIPKSPKEDLRRQIIQMHHDLPSAGHFGRWKTTELVSRNYWWPGMNTDVKKYVAGCDTCQRMKNQPRQPYGPLIPNPVPAGPWEVISMDLITQLPESDGFNAIMVVVDRLTKRAHFFPITNEFSARDLANILYERVWTQHGLPLQIISDRGTQFAAEVFQEWCKLLGIESTMSTAYHPQTDGQTERVNQTLEQYLRCYIDLQQSEWSRLLSSAEFAYNNASHEGTKTSPFYLEYGRHPRAGPTLSKELKNSDLNDIMRNRLEAQEHAKAALQLAAERMKWYHDKYVQQVPFKVGDKVMLNLKDYQKSGRKLSAQHYGPFEIEEQLSPVTFKLKWPERLVRIHPVFHASKLSPYTEASFEGQKPTLPPPDLIDGHEEFEVKEILDSRRVGRGKKKKLQYFVRWHGYNADDDNWEPVENLARAKEVIKEFYEKHPHAVRSIQATPFCIAVSDDTC